MQCPNNQKRASTYIYRAILRIYLFFVWRPHFSQEETYFEPRKMFFFCGLRQNPFNVICLANFLKNKILKAVFVLPLK